MLTTRSRLEERLSGPTTPTHQAGGSRGTCMSLSHFQRHVQPFLKCVRVGRLRFYRPEDLEHYTEAEASLPSRR